MTAIVVLGMHRSGTSLLAQMLGAMGVHMGGDFLSDENEGLLYEDREFTALNDAILHDAGGTWYNPPPLTELTVTGFRLQPALRVLAERKRQDGLWGWKDPRTALTALLWHKWLDDPRYIVIRRDRGDVVRSLIRRNGAADWGQVYDVYQNRIEQFARSVDAPVLRLRYEDLSHPKAAPLAVDKLAEFVGASEQEAHRALDCIEYRDHWGWGTIGIGCPYYKAKYDFFRWWSWILVGGLEPGDRLLNSQDVRCEVPIPLAHNALVREFLFNTHQDTMCLIEDDHVGKQNIIEQLRYKPENRKFDIVCASYVNRRGPTTAVGFTFAGDGPNEYGEYDCLVEPMKVATSGTQEYDGAALGLVLIRRWVLEAMIDGAQVDHPDEFFWFDWRGRNSQDIQFYAKARAVGARVGVDRDNDVGHIGHTIYTMKQFYEGRTEFAQTKAEVTDNG